jgi:L-ascorbate metabolism protein UlaG (beta-lactamase superfamily)
MRFVAIFLTVLMALLLGQVSVEAATGRCFAITQKLRDERLPVRYVALSADEVGITFVGHSTFLIESPGGIIIATDYAGWAGFDVVPDVVTMNHAHETHFTDAPDPRIKNVLRGWGEDGKPAHYDLKIGDVVIRNVTTDIRSWSGGIEKDGNSIFIFEVANLCIGHLGHLHHELGPAHLAVLGVLDIVMVPVDGSYTLRRKEMVETLKLLNVRLILPMHYFGPATLQMFINAMQGNFAVEINPTNSITVSEATLPKSPKMLVLPGR